MPRVIKSQTRAELVSEFYAAPSDALFDQNMIAAVRDCTTHCMERQRWNGTGPKYIKIGRSVRYRKCDVLSWLEQFQAQVSTAENGKLVTI